MKNSILATAVAFIASANAHSIFHKVSVNGVDQGQLFGVRAPVQNTPLFDVTSAAIECNTGLSTPVSSDVISVKPGDKIGTQWNHVITGPQYSGDADDPIANSHKGPVVVYMAKVDDAATSSGSGLSWFKVAEEGLSAGKWGVDTMIANKGLWSFNMPALAAGDYLMRAELITLHEAYKASGTQFYVSCAAIRVEGSGTCAPTETVKFPGAYSATDPGILISIYGSSGQPDNDGKAYAIPGPSVISCSGNSGSAPAASSSSVATVSSSTVAPVASSATTKTATTSIVVTNTPQSGVKVPTTTSAAVVSPTASTSSAPASTTFAIPSGKKLICYEEL